MKKPTLPTPVAWEFYDLEKDPFEMKNEYGNSEYYELISTMKKQLKRVRSQLNETDHNYPEIQQIIDTNWSR